MKDNQTFKQSLKYDSKNTKEQQQHLNNKLNQTIDKYSKYNNLEVKTFTCYLIAAIYITYKEMYPDLKINIPFRLKSDDSTIKNIKKEFIHEITNFDSSKTDNLDDLFNLNKASDDMIAATVVLEHIKSSIKSSTEYTSDTIKELKKKRNSNEIFINETELALEDEFIGEKRYLEIYQELLERIIDSTYTEFTTERLIPYQTELESIKRSYDMKLKADNFSTYITKDNIFKLQDLLSDLRSRLNDKLQYEILRETFPKVCNSPLIKNSLLTSIEFRKDSRKDNGFAAIYYILHTPFGKMEFQLQSNKRYFEAKKGSAFHSGIKGKEVDITSYFELVDKNDEKPLEFYLSILDDVPANSLISDTELPNFNSEEEKQKFFTTPLGQKYLKSQRIKEYRKHIKLKDKYIYTPDTKIKHKTNDGIEYIDSEIKQDPIEMDFDDYLLSLAKSISPYMNICDSAHTSFSAMASLIPKDLKDECSEILRKKDSLTCLRHILVTRLEEILKTRDDPEYIKNRGIINSLPREISRFEITKYSEQLKQKMDLDNSELERQ